MYIRKENTQINSNYNLPNNVQIDYLEYIIQEHFKKVNLNNKVNLMVHTINGMIILKTILRRFKFK